MLWNMFCLGNLRLLEITNERFLREVEANGPFSVVVEFEAVTGEAEAERRQKQKDSQADLRGPGQNEAVGASGSCPPWPWLKSRGGPRGCGWAIDL